MYYDIFGYLEEKLLLDVNNPNHMWASQFIYLTRINKALLDSGNGKDVTKVTKVL